jgi:hypothetical protein
MSSLVPSPSPVRSRPASRRVPRAGSCSSISSSAHRRTAIGGRPLARYFDADGQARELLALSGHAGSVLVLDRDAITRRDRRLIAHLASDEPPENAALVCRHYLDDANGRWCRPVCRADLQTTPFLQEAPSDHVRPDAEDSDLRDGSGNVYRLGLFPGERTTDQLRWCRMGGNEDLACDQVRLRDVVAAIESYEPARGLTERAIARHHHDPSVLVTRLRCEFDRLCASPIVLNRGLREAVLDAVERRGMSMSEIALRCGIVKRDRRGRISGETSWLARRIGIMPEGGEKAATPWIHSDVLALIAREGLGIGPREVELS